MPISEGPGRPTTEADDRPSVASLIDEMQENRAVLVERLRESALALDGVEERVLYDGFCREWTPAYYLGKTQLFHIHNFGSELRATVFVGINTLQPLIMHAQEISPGLRQTVSTASGGHATKQVKFPIHTEADVVEFMELVRVKVDYARS